MIPKSIQRLIALLPDAPTEEASEYDGLLSYSTEWHALVVGLGAGLVSTMAGYPEAAALVVAYALGEEVAAGDAAIEVAAEPWYGIGGVVIGVLGGFLLRPFV